MRQHRNQPRFRPDRRHVLAGGLAAVGGFTLFGSRAAAAGRFLRPQDEDDEGNILVVLQLTGGNDGLNTIVPYQEDPYHGVRKELSVAEGDVLRLDDYRGFHPRLQGMRRLYDRGELAIVEGVGYADPNRSHFTSFDIWHAASRLGRVGGDGWLARLGRELRQGAEGDVNLAVHIGNRLPYSLYAPESHSVCFRDPGIYRWDRNEEPICEAAESSAMGGESKTSDVSRIFLKARESSAEIREATARYEPRVEYPRSELGNAFQVVAALIQERVGARILSVEIAGFDTHAKQKPRHEALLEIWDTSLSAFLEDLRGTPQGERTVVMVFSEFGRRVAENASGGTDHGTAGPMFLAGPRVKGGIYGEHPSMQDLPEGDLRFTTDFRSVYATVIKDWFGVDATALLGQSYPTLPLIG